MVQGIYYFSSETAKQYPILYPFPTDTIYGKPFNILVKNLNTGDTIVYRANNDSSSIVFPVLVNGKSTLLIAYCQRLKSNKAKYVLLSANYWNTPLKRVDYKLITESDFIVKGFSIRPDKEIKLGDKKIYLWQKENFMPTKDFEIEY